MAKRQAKVNGEAQELTPPSDEELLRRLEEANRMLEADEKSRVELSARAATTPGHSRKGSGSSIVSSTSSNSFYSTQNSNETEDTNDLIRKRDRDQTKPPPTRHSRQHHVHHLRVPHHHHHLQQHQHRHHHQQQQLEQQQRQNVMLPSPQRRRTFTHPRSASLDGRKTPRPATYPQDIPPSSLLAAPDGIPSTTALFRPSGSGSRRAGCVQNARTEFRRNSSSSVGGPRSQSVERPTSPSLSELLFGKAGPNPPPHVAILWDALNSGDSSAQLCGNHTKVSFPP